MSGFSSGHNWAEHDYVANVILKHFLPFAVLILVGFVGSIIYVCIKKSRRVPLWVLLLQVVGAIILLQTCLNYASFVTTMQSIERETHGIITYKDYMQSTLTTLNGTLATIGTNVLKNCTSCDTWEYQSHATELSKILQTSISSIDTFIEKMISPEQVTSIFDTLDQGKYWFTIAQRVIYVFFGIVAALAIFEFLNPRNLKQSRTNAWWIICLLLIALPILLMAFGTMFGMIALADFCDNPLDTVTKLTSNEDLAFYFNCTPLAEGGPYPQEFTKPISDLPTTFDDLPKYLFPLISLETILDFTTEIAALSYAGCTTALKHEQKIENCTTCQCDFELFLNLTQQIGTQCKETGVFGVFQCGPPHQRLQELSNTVCTMMSPLVAFFFLFLGLAGHTIFLYYFQAQD